MCSLELIDVREESQEMIIQCHLRQRSDTFHLLRLIAVPYLQLWALPFNQNFRNVRNGDKKWNFWLKG